MSDRGPTEFIIRAALKQVLLDLRLAGVTHLPKRSFGGETRWGGGAHPPEVTSSRAQAGPGWLPEGQVGRRSVGEVSRTGPQVFSSSQSTPAGIGGDSYGMERSSVEGLAKTSQPVVLASQSGGGKGGVRSRDQGQPDEPSPPSAQQPVAGDLGFSLTLPIWAQELRDPGLSREEKKRRLAALEAKVAKCTRCPELVANRSRTVFSDGNPESRLVFVGEAPGAEEDRQGIPFVGRAGQLLTDIITKGMGLRREDVYICNVIKCRPPENRTPTPTEVANCRDFLDEQLAIIRPEFICCLGSVAAQRILGTKQSMTRLRGQVIPFGRVKVVCTYHPAYLLRNPEAKRETWQDIKLLMREMGLPLPPARRDPR
jgi:uracil-DNA glycosylase family 4